ncbi:MAG: GNAT family N-acetyltransferase [Planctomycetota bacterium]
MPTLSVAEASLDDLPHVAPLVDAYRRFYGQPADRAAAERFVGDRMRTGESVVLLARRGDRAVGYVQLYPSYSTVALARVWVLNDLYVDAAERGSGVGAALMAAAEAHGRATGATRLVLVTAVDNSAAKRLYERHGWRPYAEYDHYVCFLGGG